MLPNKLQVKLFIEQNGSAVELEPFVPVFHEWIKKNALGELLIDVADYAHVHNGPGVVLIGHGSDYFIDLAQGRAGLLYSRKRDALADANARVRDAFRRAFHAAKLLESEPALGGHVRFRTDEAQIRLVDRTSSDGSSSAAAELKPVLDELYAGSSYSTELVSGPKQLPTLRISAPGAPDLATLLARLPS